MPTHGYFWFSVFVAVVFVAAKVLYDRGHLKHVAAVIGVTVLTCYVFAYIYVTIIYDVIQALLSFPLSQN